MHGESHYYPPEKMSYTGSHCCLMFYLVFCRLFLETHLHIEYIQLYHDIGKNELCLTAPEAQCIKTGFEDSYTHSAVKSHIYLIITYKYRKC